MRLIRIWLMAMFVMSVTALAGCGGNKTETQEPAQEQSTMQEPSSTEGTTMDTTSGTEETPDTGAAMDTTAGGEEGGE